MAVLLVPVVLPKSARYPYAVLSLPVVFEKRAPYPLAELSDPEVLAESAVLPMAVFAVLEVLGESPEKPSAVLPCVLFIKPDGILCTLKTRLASSVVPMKLMAGSVPALPLSDHVFVLSFSHVAPFQK